MKEIKDKLLMTIENINTIDKAIEVFEMVGRK